MVSLLFTILLERIGRGAGAAIFYDLCKYILISQKRSHTLCTHFKLKNTHKTKDTIIRPTVLTNGLRWGLCAKYIYNIKLSQHLSSFRLPECSNTCSEHNVVRFEAFIERVVFRALTLWNSWTKSFRNRCTDYYILQSSCHPKHD